MEMKTPDAIQSEFFEMVGPDLKNRIEIGCPELGNPAVPLADQNKAIQRAIDGGFFTFEEMARFARAVAESARRHPEIRKPSPYAVIPCRLWPGPDWCGACGEQIQTGASAHATAEGIVKCASCCGCGK